MIGGELLMRLSNLTFVRCSNLTFVRCFVFCCNNFKFPLFNFVPRHQSLAWLRFFNFCLFSCVDLAAAFCVRMEIANPQPTLAALFEQLTLRKYLGAFEQEEYIVGDLANIPSEQLAKLIPAAGPRMRLELWINEQREQREQKQRGNTYAQSTATGGTTDSAAQTSTASMATVAASTALQPAQLKVDPVTMRNPAPCAAEAKGRAGTSLLHTPKLKLHSHKQRPVANLAQSTATPVIAPAEAVDTERTRRHWYGKLSGKIREAEVCLEWLLYSHSVVQAKRSDELNLADVGYHVSWAYYHVSEQEEFAESVVELALVSDHAFFASFLFQNNPAMRVSSLNLDRCKIGDAGVRVIATHLLRVTNALCIFASHVLRVRLVLIWPN